MAGTKNRKFAKMKKRIKKAIKKFFIRINPLP